MEKYCKSQSTQDNGEPIKGSNVPDYSFVALVKVNFEPCFVEAVTNVFDFSYPIVCKIEFFFTLSIPKSQRCYSYYFISFFKL